MGLLIFCSYKLVYDSVHCRVDEEDITNSLVNKVLTPNYTVFGGSHVACVCIYVCMCTSMYIHLQTLLNNIILLFTHICSMSLCLFSFVLVVRCPCLFGCVFIWRIHRLNLHSTLGNLFLQMTQILKMSPCWRVKLHAWFTLR